MKAKVSYEDCSLYVLGMDMNCPLCRVLVKSGEHHMCSRPEIEAPKVKPTQKRKQKGGRG